MPRYIDCELACAEVDKGDLLVGDNAGWAKEMIYRTPPADVVPRLEVVWAIFDDVDKIAYRYLNDADYSGGDMIYDLNELKKKYTEGKI